MWALNKRDNECEWPQKFQTVNPSEGKSQLEKSMEKAELSILVLIH